MTRHVEQATVYPARATTAHVARAQERVITKRCRECHRAFTLTAAKRDWFITRGLAVLRRCDGCRAARRGQPWDERPIVR